MAGTKRSGKAAARAAVKKAPSNPVPADLQQRILDVFRDACAGQSASDLVNNLQVVKQHLYNRDFANAFSCEAHLWSYVTRWSPSRALAYLLIFLDVESHLTCKMLGSNSGMQPRSLPVSIESESSDTTLSITCLGGGAGAELVACAAWLHMQITESSRFDRVQVHCLDIADWSAISSKLREAIEIPLSRSSDALLPSGLLSSTFTRRDILDPDFDPVRPLVRSSDMITLMFTLNELYSTSLPKTQHFLFQLTMAARPGALLLVVDSPGSYSGVKINGHDKKYPMQWLLDYTLLGQDQEASSPDQPRWEKLVSDFRWFRIAAGLSYPVDLENMRYQIHLYRRR